MPLQKDDFGIAEAGGRIYTFGGMTGSRGSALDDAAVYDPASDAWDPLPPLPTARRSVRAATVGEVIYAIGGSTPDATTGAVEGFDIRTARWEILPPMPTPRFGVALVAFGDRLHALGGFRDGTSLDAHEAFDPASGRWETQPPLPTSRTHAAGVAVGEGILVLGGQARGVALAVADYFDGHGGDWRAGTDLPLAMSNFAASVVDGRVHVLRHEFHLVLAPGGTEWSTAAPMPTPRHGLGSVAVGDVLYAFGGCHPQLFDLDAVEAFVPSQRLGRTSPSPTAEG